MAHADFSDISLSVLTDEFLSADDERKAVVIMMAQEGEMEVFGL